MSLFKLQSLEIRHRASVFVLEYKAEPQGSGTRDRNFRYLQE
jgi:hypothetical protein